MTSAIRAACLLGGLVTGTAESAGAIQFHANLTPIRIDARPGHVIQRQFALTLASHEARTRFKIHVEDWYRSEDGKQSYYQAPGTLASSCASWVKLNPVEAAVEPGGTLNVRVTLAVPGSARPGGYWCALTVDEVPDLLADSPQSVGVRFLASVSVGIFVNVLPVRRSAKIVDVSVVAGEVRVKLRNDGNCPLGVEGRIEFLRPGDTKPAAVIVFPRGTVLPEPIDSAVFALALPGADALPPGPYRVQILLDIGLDHYIGARKVMAISHEPLLSSPAAGKAP